MEARLRRSVLLVPGHQPQRIRDAFASNADAVVIDLEDGVPLQEKNEARQVLPELIGELEFGAKECLLRINPIGSIECMHDLLLLPRLPRLPHTIVLPTAESPREVELLDAWLTQLEPPGHTPIQIAVILESAQGLFNAAEIVQASSRMTAVFFGGGDLSGQVGCAEQWEPLQQARHTVVLAATLAGLDAIDVPFRDVDDKEGLRAECDRVVRMGFRGKGLIHPSQAGIVNEAFTPRQSEIDWARKVLAAAELHGTGALRVGGRFVDPVVIKRAQKIQAAAAFLEEIKSD